MSLSFITGAIAAGATIAVLSTLPVLAGDDSPTTILTPAPQVLEAPLSPQPDD